ncbi:MaoC family dehydratase [Dactylosporangium sp. CA-052675]|uniref:MaoC family dehydratase n=1 Tax=Dactylosporangium sp. CA-052675 TaxID=3239927 RepID=UPI003D8A57E1
MSTVTATASDVADYRAVVRGILGAGPGDGSASPIHPFVLASPAFERMTAGMRERSGDGAMVHLGQEITVYRLIRPGDTVTTGLEVLGARREPRGVRLAIRCTLDDGGTPLADLVTHVLFGGAQVPEPFGDIPQSVAPAALGPARPPTVSVHTISREAIREYARVSLDDNPIHLEDEAAAAAGFPGVIVHGMSVLALVCEDAVDRFAAGDPDRVRALACRFSAPVQPDEPIEVAYAGTTDVVTFTVRTPRGPALKSGWIRLGDPDE